MKSSKKTLKKIEKDPLEGDLSYLFKEGRWKQIRFELKPKNKTITIRLNEDLLDALKAEAEDRGLKYQKLVRLVLERLVLKAS